MKLDNFATLLHEYIASKRRLPFHPVTNGCAVFVADGVLAITGVDPMADIRGTFETEDEAQAVLQAQGGFIAFLDRLYPRVDRLEAQRGDIALVKDDAGLPSVALVVGSGWAAKPGFEEMLQVPMSEARIVWRT